MNTLLCAAIAGAMLTAGCESSESSSLTVGVVTTDGGDSIVALSLDSLGGGGISAQKAPNGTIVSQVSVISVSGVVEGDALVAHATVDDQPAELNVRSCTAGTRHTNSGYRR